MSLILLFFFTGFPKAILSNVTNVTVFTASLSQGESLAYNNIGLVMLKVFESESMLVNTRMSRLFCETDTAPLPFLVLCSPIHNMLNSSMLKTRNGKGIFWNVCSFDEVTQPRKIYIILGHNYLHK